MDGFGYYNNNKNVWIGSVCLCSGANMAREYHHKIVYVVETRLRWSFGLLQMNAFRVCTGASSQLQSRYVSTSPSPENEIYNNKRHRPGR